MMNECRDYLEMTFHSINCFADDGRLDVTELGKIFEIAQRDGIVDLNEKRILQNIISRIQPHELDKSMRYLLNEIKVAVHKWQADIGAQPT